MDEFTQKQLNELQNRLTALEGLVGRNKDAVQGNTEALDELTKTINKTLTDYDKRLLNATSVEDIRNEFRMEMSKGASTLLWKGLIVLVGIATVAVTSYITEWWKG